MAEQYNQSRNTGRRRQDNDRRQGSQGASIDTSRIKFEDIDAELFNDVAEETARTIAGARDRNKSTQIRKFYDEVCLWEERTRMNPAKFDDMLPFIKMINAKAAYANGRRLVDDNFSTLIGHCVKQVNTVESLKTFKTFFEAFLGFHKRYDN